MIENKLRKEEKQISWSIYRQSIKLEGPYFLYVWKTMNQDGLFALYHTFLYSYFTYFHHALY